MEVLNQAIQLYIGVGASPFPKEDETRVIERFGSEVGDAILEQVREIISELRSIEPDWEKHTLSSGSKWAVDCLKSRHSEIDEKAGSALEWIYSWWWK